MSETITFESSWAGNRVEFVARNGSLKFADRVDPASQRSRKSLAKAVAERFPNVDIDDIDAHLLAMLDKREQAKEAKPDELGDPNDASDAALAQMPQSVRDEALAMLKAPDLIKRVCSDIETVGVVGEHALALSIYLVGTSRLLMTPSAAILQGDSSSGKSYTISKTASLFPPEAMIRATDMTPNALYYMPPGSLRHKFVVAGERSRVQDDDRAESTRAMREMLSERVLRKVMPQKTDDGIETIIIENPGPIAFIESTTLAEVFPEDANRALLLASDDGREQTRAVVRSIASRFASGNSTDSDRVQQRHHAAQRMLRRVEVLVPYGQAIGELIPDDRPHARRVISQVFTMVQAVALLHQFQRLDQVDHGAVVHATLDDYRAARLLLIAPIGRALDGRLPDHVVSLAEWMLEHIKHGETFSVKSLDSRKDCRWPRSTIYELVKPLQSAGFLSDAGQDGRSNLFRVSGSIPDVGDTWLPTVEDLEAQQ